MNCEIVKTDPYQEDEMYYSYNVSRIWGELVRPNVSNSSSRWNGFSAAELRIAGLARAIQTTNCIHQCSSRYCLAKGPKCRFFFPWPMQMQQQYDENTERIALQRRCPADDRWVPGHDLEMTMFNTGQVNVVGFDPNINCDCSKRYGCKYNAKPYKHFFLDVGTGPEDAAKRFLQCRTVGLPLAMFRQIGAHVVRSTRPVVNFATQFVPSSSRSVHAVARSQDDPARSHPVGYVSDVQRYALRHPDLRHLRIEQYCPGPSQQMRPIFP